MNFPAKIKNILKQGGAVKLYYTLYTLGFKIREEFLLELSPYRYAQYRYKRRYGKRADLNNPATFDEKLLWLMLYWRHPLKTECGDKYTMRTYVQNHGWGEILPELLGVFRNSSEIDFDSLPSKFVLKCTHGCGFNIICHDKAMVNRDEIRQKLDQWMKTDYSKFAGELHYASMTPRIICETLLDDLEGNRPTDYKIYCFGGKAHCTLVALDRDIDGHTDKFDIYDVGWNTKLPYYKTSLLADRNSPKPEAYDEMIEAAEALSKPFPFVRMDFYNISGKAVLGEMTFTPAGCIQSGYTELGQKQLGALIELPKRMK